MKAPTPNHWTSRDSQKEEVFETQEEASKFEDFIWDQCQEAHIEVDVTTTKTTIRSLEDAKKSLEEVLSEEEDDEE